jgi:hypothetical protein
MISSPFPRLAEAVAPSRGAVFQLMTFGCLVAAVPATWSTAGIATREKGLP